jgi:hypothetical protein
MSTSTYITVQKNQRETNWANYFAFDPDGQALLTCIRSTLKAGDWATPTAAARQISAIFRVSSLAHHSTPVSINENNEIEISGLSKVTQQFQLISCVASTFGFSLV